MYLSLEYEPEGLVEQVGDKLGIVERQVDSDLERFKAFIEDQGYASGAWRGEINAGAGVGTPGVERAAASQGDSGKAGVSGKAVAAGVAAAAAAGVAAVAAAKSGSSEEETTTVDDDADPAGRDGRGGGDRRTRFRRSRRSRPWSRWRSSSPSTRSSPSSATPCWPTHRTRARGKHHLLENDEGRPGTGV